MSLDDKKTYLSQEKYDELKKELTFLAGARRGEIAKQLEEAKSFGDLSENAEYHQAREAQASVEDRIGQLEVLLESVEIVKHHKSSVVEVGTTVSLEKVGLQEQRTFEIVGSEEVDMKQGRISLDSPLGKHVMGKKEGQEFMFETPAGKSIRYKVLRIE